MSGTGILTLGTLPRTFLLDVSIFGHKVAFVLHYLFFSPPLLHHLANLVPVVREGEAICFLGSLIVIVIWWFYGERILCRKTFFPHFHGGAGKVVILMCSQIHEHDKGLIWEQRSLSSWETWLLVQVLNFKIKIWPPIMVVMRPVQSQDKDKAKLWFGPFLSFYCPRLPSPRGGL